MGSVLATILVLLQIAAALAYLAAGDWRRTIYWLAAATITVVVTW